MERKDNQLTTYGNGFKRNLSVALETGNRMEISIAINNFKHQNGAANFPALLCIPSDERIPAMAKHDIRRTSMMITASLTMALESMNLARPMNEGQIMDLASAIIETAAEDNLAIEDLVLFLQKMIRGQYGPMYESMDIPKFMDKFEEYREDRYQSLRNIQEENHAQYKALPVNERFSEMSDTEVKKHKEAYISHLINQSKHNHK